MVGRTVSHYRVLELLGSGGMGTVYRAEDTRLNRQVALKFLPADLVRDRHALDRFQREARAASALNHPHICTIHDIGEAEGQPFIVMELLEGQTLKARLQGRPLPIPEIVEVGLQLADALEAAHAKGCIHRDIKPANVFITTRGMAKLLDFGLAKLTAEPNEASEALTEAGEWVTGVGMALGTVGYMSPEQVRGETLDARTDLFSFGVVLYEMATGTTPFRGATSGVVLSEILTKAPTSAARLNPDVPADLERLVNKLLEKDRALRCPSATELRVDLERLRRTLSAPAAGGAPSVAVLPFADMSPARDQEYFCEGISEEIINALTTVEGLKVASRTSSFQFKGKALDVREVGRELGVEMILEGSTRTAGSRLRVTAQLISAKDGYHIWSEKYDRSPEDIFAIQDEISTSIANALKMQLGRGSGAPSVRRHTPTPDAYDHYLRGRYYWNRRHEGLLSRSVESFRKAIDADPTYALAYTGLADSYNVLGYYGYEAPEGAFSRARTCAEKAIEIDPGLAEPYVSLGYVKHHYEWDWKAAERSYRMAIERNEKYAVAHQWNAIFLASLGRFDESLAEIRRAHDLDPLSLVINTVVGWLCHLAGRHEEALAQLRRTFELDQGLPLLLSVLAQACEQAGESAEALRLHRQAVEQSGQASFYLSDLGYCLARLGDHSGAMAVLRQLEAMSRKRYVSPLHHALVWIGLEDFGEALRWIEAALKERSSTLVYSAVDPRFAPLRMEERFRTVLGAIGVAGVPDAASASQEAGGQ